MYVALFFCDFVQLFGGWILHHIELFYMRAYFYVSLLYLSFLKLKNALSLCELLKDTIYCNTESGNHAWIYSLLLKINRNGKEGRIKIPDGILSLLFRG